MPKHPLLLKRVCIFCGSSAGNDAAYAAAARAMGQLLGQRSIELVYGGGHVGLMGTLADACLQSGGQVIGVIPRALAEKEVAHRGLTALHVVESMHLRKAMMADLADAFVALPGGYGTLEELFEVMTWSQLGIHSKPCALLNVNGYFDPLLAMSERAIAEGFVRAVHRDLLLVADEPGQLLDLLAGPP